MKFPIPLLTLCVLAIAGVLCGTVRLHAQATTASIHGTVSDSSGAVLPDATVIVVNTSTNISAFQKTDSKGYFIFPDLHIGGPYTVTVGKDGFQKFVSTGIMLDLSPPGKSKPRCRSAHLRKRSRSIQQPSRWRPPICS